MKKLLLISIILLNCCIAAFAQEDTVYFLYKGTINPNQQGIQSDNNIKLVVNQNGNMFFTIQSKTGTTHKLSYFLQYDQKKSFPLGSILIKNRVYYLDFLAKLDEKDFLNEFGYVGYQNSSTVFYIIPLLDIEGCNVPALEVSFFSKFLLPNE